MIADWHLNLASFNLYHSLDLFGKQIDFFLFLIFSEKTGFGILCKLSPIEQIYLKCQNLFTRKNKKNISKCLLKFLPTALSVTSTEKPTGPFISTEDPDQSSLLCSLA